MSVKKNSSVTASRFSTNGILSDMEIKYFEGAVWAKVFEHNNKSSTVLFTDVNECLKTSSLNKYSRLYLLDNLKNINNKYEFLLQYPDDKPEQYNRWIQNNNPCNEYVTPTTTGDGTAEEYTAVHIDWSGAYWGGMTRQNTLTSTSINPTFLSGSVGHNNWWYAIGCSVTFSSGGVSGIPGPSVSIPGRVQLWVRIDNLPEETKCQITKECMIANDFYEV